jgi:hypothetical protein
MKTPTDHKLYELAAEKANEYIQLIPNYPYCLSSQHGAIALFGLLLAKEQMQGYERGLFKILLLSNLLFIELIYKFICRSNEFRIVALSIFKAINVCNETDSSRS